MDIVTDGVSEFWSDSTDCDYVIEVSLIALQSYSVCLILWRNHCLTLLQS